MQNIWLRLLIKNESSRKELAFFSLGHAHLSGAASCSEDQLRLLPEETAKNSTGNQEGGASQINDNKQEFQSDFMYLLEDERFLCSVFFNIFNNYKNKWK